MRAKTATKRQVPVDQVHNSIEVAKLINRVMQSGKKSIATRHVYAALEQVGEKSGQKGLDVLLTALGNIKPKTEVKSRRIGGAAYQVPLPVSPRRQFALSIRWLVEYAKARDSKEHHTFASKLAAEILDAANGIGGAIKKRDDIHKIAEANKAFSHFRW